jgi:hypothetical protein
MVRGDCGSDEPKFPQPYLLTEALVFSNLHQNPPALYSDTLKIEAVFYSAMSQPSPNTLHKAPAEDHKLETTVLRLANDESFLFTNWLRGTELFFRQHSFAQSISQTSRS